MPLTYANPEEVGTIKRIRGKLETIRFLESLGFVQGGEVALVAKCGGNVIVRVKGSRVAIARDIADRIEI